MIPKACCIAGIVLEVRLGLKTVLGSSADRTGGKGINWMIVLLRGRMISTPQAMRAHDESCQWEFPMETDPAERRWLISVVELYLLYKNLRCQFN